MRVWCEVSESEVKSTRPLFGSPRILFQQMVFGRDSYVQTETQLVDTPRYLIFHSVVFLESPVYSTERSQGDHEVCRFMSEKASYAISDGNGRLISEDTTISLFLASSTGSVWEMRRRLEVHCCFDAPLATLHPTALGDRAKLSTSRQHRKDEIQAHTRRLRVDSEIFHMLAEPLPRRLMQYAWQAVWSRWIMIER